LLISVELLAECGPLCGAALVCTERPFGEFVERGCGVVVGLSLGTLLGPEGTPAPRCGDGVVSVVPGSSWMYTAGVESGWVLRVGRIGGWLFENCTVDASIFVVKLLRAHGGCLGIRSR
jgi:hypothetical protein